MDDWENFGFDADGDGTVDINLPLMGASPRTRMSVSSSTTRPLAADRDGSPMKRAFAWRPGNPDGTPGSTCMSTRATSSIRRGRGGLAGTCSNGVDDDGADTARYLDSNSEVVPAIAATSSKTLVSSTAAASDAGASVSPTWLKTGQVALVAWGATPLDDHAIISCRSAASSL